MESLPSIFRLADPIEANGLLGALSDRFATHLEPEATTQLVFYDTFDWRLYKRSSRLWTEKLNRGLALMMRSEGSARALRVPIKSPPDFVWNLPEGPVKSNLAPVAQMRRLLPIVELAANGSAVHILDARDKTVARVNLAQYSVGRPGAETTLRQLPLLLTTTPIRGYDAEYGTLLEFIRSILRLQPADLDPFVESVGAIGRRPGDYSSKLELSLSLDIRSDAALKTIHKQLLRTLRRNEPGVRSNLDTEFLHDFRVAVRRTRSALTQIKEVYPLPVVERFKADFAWLGRVTGPCRDLHVYQLKLPDYRRSLPASARSVLEPLELFLERHLDEEQRKLVQALDTARYQNLIEDWVQFLNTELPGEGAPANAMVPIGVTASERIWRCYRRVLRRGRAIGRKTPPDGLHRLRIDCKKLRYLLEFFRSLYSAEGITPLIKDLKRLQDNLGDFNDLEVQQIKLGEYANSMVEENLAPASTLMAMGRLVGTLAERQSEERNDFKDHFARFSSQQNRRRFRKLFRPSRSVES